jgi:SAM-dependent methyltransferase
MMIDDKSASPLIAVGRGNERHSAVVSAQEGMAARPCPICGSADESHVYSDAHFDLARLDEFAFASRKIPEYMHYRLIACPVCDLLYASPAPSLETLARAYRDAGFDSGEEARYASRTYAAYLPAIIHRLPDKDGAIDIGTGDGAFLRELLAAGFTGVAGVEPSTTPISTAQDDVRELIRHDIFRPDLFEPGRYSLITCFQTMEHVHDPSELALGAYSRLKKGGAAFFIGHNRRGLVNRLLGMRSPIFDIEHLQLFSPKSARALFERAGFVNVEVHRIVNRYPLQYWTKLLPIPKTIKVGGLAALKPTGIGRLPLPMAVGNIAVIGYK